MVDNFTQVFSLTDNYPDILLLIIPVNKRLKGLPLVGSLHGSDILQSFGGLEMTNYLIHFVNNLDPNGGSEHNWPKYTKEDPNLLIFQDGFIPIATDKDTYRKDGLEFLTELSLVNPI